MYIYMSTDIYKRKEARVLLVSRREMAAKPDEAVKVVVRIRPMSSEEDKNGNMM
jgi:hypothetical protein